MLIPLSLLRGGKRWGSGDSSLTPSHPISSLLLSFSGLLPMGLKESIFPSGLSSCPSSESRP